MTRLLNVFVRSARLAGFALLVACAAPEVLPPTDAEKNEVAKTALSSAIYTEHLLAQCAAVDPNLAQQAADIRLMWMSEHGELLAGADAQYSLALAHETVDYGGHALALNAVRFLHTQQAQAEAELRLNERSLNNQRLVCERRLNALENELVQPLGDLDDPQRTALVRQTLTALTPSRASMPCHDAPTNTSPHNTAPTPCPEPPITLKEAPTLALQIPRQQPPGRSYRTVETQWQTQCASGELLVITNEWPHEAYAAFCPDDSASAPTFIICEWGECDLM